MKEHQQIEPAAFQTAFPKEMKEMNREIKSIEGESLRIVSPWPPYKWFIQNNVECKLKNVLFEKLGRQVVSYALC